MEKENGNYYGIILGLYWDNGKENGNYYSILWQYRANGKEHGNLGMHREHGAGKMSCHR